MLEGSPQIAPVSSISFGQASLVIKRRSDIIGRVSIGRLRGRAGVAQRVRRLRVEPLCRDCAAKGIIRAATVPDHIVPLVHGGSDDDSNIRCLCAGCHARHTAAQFGHRRTVAVGPDGWPAE
ncbi:MAG: HNH endonuclease [Sphingomonadaceae bacterium PASS1]|nr:MAG: HNH endonuclease [Sphingomonadaceae bacterium PASS1]